MKKQKIIRLDDGVREREIEAEQSLHKQKVAKAKAKADSIELAKRALSAHEPSNKTRQNQERVFKELVKQGVIPTDYKPA